MKRFLKTCFYRFVIFVFCVYIVFAGSVGEAGRGSSETSSKAVVIQGKGGVGDMIIDLPAPKLKGSVSVEEALNRRYSVREFQDRPVELSKVSQLLWACGGKRLDGVTGATRTYPSAGACYPLEVYLVAGMVDGVEPGVYRYNHKKHRLELVLAGDVRLMLARSALGQKFIAEAPASIIITAVYKRTVRVYGERGYLRYVPMDAGHAAQNIYLESVALGLGTVAVGAFIDSKVSAVIGIERDETPLYIFPFGYPSR